MFIAHYYSCAIFAMQKVSRSWASFPSVGHIRSTGGVYHNCSSFACPGKCSSLFTCTLFAAAVGALFIFSAVACRRLSCGNSNCRRCCHLMSQRIRICCMLPLLAHYALVPAQKLATCNGCSCICNMQARANFYLMTAAATSVFCNALTESTYMFSKFW